MEEVVEAGVCTGCAGCLIACPQRVIRLDPEAWTVDLDPRAQVEADPRRCVYAESGCTVCARACPRFRVTADDLDAVSLIRADRPDDVLGPYQAILLVRATDERIAGLGQDGGLASAALVFALERGDIDAALVSGFDGEMRPEPRLARTREEVLACAGSRYTYSPNTMAIEEADRLGLKRLGLVSVGCQTSIPTIALVRGARKLARRFALTIGLLCSKTFTDGLFDELLEQGFGVARSRVTKVNIKGRLQVWYSGNGDGGDGYLEVPLKACRAFTRPGCATCPDFAAEHADLSLGGIGKDPGMTLAIVRSERGRDLVERMESEGWITTADAGSEDPAAVALVEKLAAAQKLRWPGVETPPAPP